MTQLYFFDGETIGIRYTGEGHASFSDETLELDKAEPGEDDPELDLGEAHAFFEGITGDLKPISIAFSAGVRPLMPGEVAPVPDDVEELESDLKASLELDFGLDTLSFLLTNEAGTGIGAGGSAGEETGASATANIRAQPPIPKLSIAMVFKNLHTMGMALRFHVRTLIHILDSLDLILDWGKNLAKLNPFDGGSGEDTGDFSLLKTVSIFWWLPIFTLFAICDTLRDLIEYDPGWVAKLLEELNFESEQGITTDLSGAIGIAGVELGMVNTVKINLPLGSLVAPILPFLTSIGDEPPPDGPQFTDMVLPQLTAIIENRLSLQAGGALAKCELESTGTLGEATFTLPRGSTYRKKLDVFGKEIARAAYHWRKSKQRDASESNPNVQRFRHLLELFDQELTSVLDPNPGAAVKTLGEINAFVIGQLSGQPVPYPGDDTSPEGQVVLAALRKTGLGGGLGCCFAPLHGIALQPGSPLMVKKAEGELGDSPRSLVSIHVDDHEKLKLEDPDSGFSYPEAVGAPDAPVLVNRTFTLQLPLATVRRVAWNSWDPGEGEGAPLLDGIILAFDTERDAREFAGPTRGQTDTTWLREGLYWIWLDQDLAGDLHRPLGQQPTDPAESEQDAAVVLPEGGPEIETPEEPASEEPVGPQGVPLPELHLSAACDVLRIVFEEIAADTVTESPILSAADEVHEVGIWRVALLSHASAGDVYEISQQINANQPLHPESHGYGTGPAVQATESEDDAGPSNTEAEGPSAPGTGGSGRTLDGLDDRFSDLVSGLLGGTLAGAGVQPTFPSSIFGLVSSLERLQEGLTSVEPRASDDSEPSPLDVFGLFTGELASALSKDVVDTDGFVVPGEAADDEIVTADAEIVVADVEVDTSNVQIVDGVAGDGQVQDEESTEATGATIEDEIVTADVEFDTSDVEIVEGVGGDGIVQDAEEPELELLQQVSFEPVEEEPPPSADTMELLDEDDLTSMGGFGGLNR